MTSGTHKGRMTKLEKLKTELSRRLTQFEILHKHDPNPALLDVFVDQEEYLMDEISKLEKRK